MMSSMAGKALRLKEEGNQHFKKQQWATAESLYTQAILVEPKNPVLYTNRAMAKIQLAQWDSVIKDCETCLELSPSGGKTLKPHYYMARAHAALGNHDDAVKHAKTAYDEGIATNDKSTPTLAALVLECKKAHWDQQERKRTRETAELESEVLYLLGRDKQELLRLAGDDAVERHAIEEESQVKMDKLMAIFDTARSNAEKKREVPDWAIDSITFSYMLDPVMTKNGHSYERSSIMQHLEQNDFDPLTREPLKASDLRPNLALRQACEEFLAENGWAADW